VQYVRQSDTNVLNFDYQLPKGIYIYQIKQGAQLANGKLIVE
jgi:hypothetical protein